MGARRGLPIMNRSATDAANFYEFSPLNYLLVNVVQDPRTDGR